MSLRSTTFRISAFRCRPPLSPISRRLASTSSATPPSQSSADKKKAYSHTLKLPKTTFPLKHKDVVAAEKLYRKKTCDELYKHQISENPGPLFILHDGPPYANGHLHMGHALNKVLKDIINRYKVISGHRVHYVPGWDCHGLPIEQKALAAIGKSHTSLLPNQVRLEARQVALQAIDIQKEEMRSLGVMADWDGQKGTYRTLDHDFEIRQLRLFQSMVQKGLVSHRLRPVYYSPSSRTALAEAELDYKDGHKSRSVFVAFPVDEKDMSDDLRAIYESVSINAEPQLSLAIWTTTPWSLPGNSGVAVHQDMDYGVVSTREGRLLVIAIERKEAMQQTLGPLHIVGKLTGSQLAGTRYSHLFHPKEASSPKPLVFTAGHVTSQAGTGLVHSAPAHGYEDYVAFANAGIMPEQLRCPVDDDGCFTKEMVSWANDESVSSLVGKEVLGEGTLQMVELLSRKGVLLAEETIEHRYPYDWKSKKPIIIRATPQWFADVEHIKKDAMEALDSVHFHPPQAQKRLQAFTSSRAEWCISRQRSWGVPIPILFDSDGKPVLDQESLSHVISILDDKGVDHWWSGPVEDFIPPSYQGQRLSKGYDTLDVWFDSGSSWTLLREEALRSPDQPLADVYLEGSDQHRGWFQSSLLTKIIGTEDKKAPYRTVITHGFVMDEAGDKMSKSAGNGLSPMEIIHGLEKSPAYGADVLRAWAASVDYTSDASIGPSSISHASEIVRRLRNTARFLLANSSGEGRIPLDKVTLRPIDQYVLHQFNKTETIARAAYEDYNFSRVLNTTSVFAISTLSTMYFDIIKDTLYCDREDSPRRKAVIAVLQHVLERIVQILAPIVPHLAEELYDHMPNRSRSSVFLETWKPSLVSSNDLDSQKVELLLSIKPKLQHLMEEARSAKHIKKSSEAEFWMEPKNGGDLADTMTTNASLLSDILGVSGVYFGAPPATTTWSHKTEVDVDGRSYIFSLVPSSQHQCPRCWLHSAEAEDQLCPRCAAVV